MPQSIGNAKNILVGASPLFISNIDSTVAGYEAQYANSEPGQNSGPAFATGTSYTDTLNAITSGTFYYRNVGYTNNGLQITYNPTFDSVTQSDIGLFINSARFVYIEVVGKQVDVLIDQH